MDLVKIWEIIWKYKWLFILAFIASSFLGYWGYQQSKVVYETQLNIVLEDPGFGIGRARSLPNSGGDYGRLVSLTPTYAFLVTSDEVIKRVEKEVGPISSQISAEPVQNTSVITLKVSGNDPQHIVKIASEVAKTFSQYIKEKQEKNNVPSNDRIIVSILGSPSPPTQLQSRKAEIAFLFFLAPLVLTFLFSAAVENISQRKARVKLVKEGKEEARGASQI